MKTKTLLTLSFLLFTITVWANEKANTLLPKPQEINWNHQSFNAKEVSLNATGNIEKTIDKWLEKHTIRINRKSKKQINVKLVESIPEAKINSQEAYRLNI